MSVAFDAAASNSVASNSGTTLSWTHTPVGTPTAVSVGLENYTAIATVTGVTYGGNAMTKAVAQAITGQSTSMEMWGLPNPPSGAQTVVVTFSATGSYCEAGSITVTGSDTTTTFTASAGAEGLASPPSISVTSNVGELVVSAIGTTIAVTTQTEGGSQTKRWGVISAGGNSASGATVDASASSTGMSWTLDSTRAWGVVAASFKAAGGGGGVTYPQLERGIRGLHRGVAVGSYH